MLWIAFGDRLEPQDRRVDDRRGRRADDVVAALSEVGVAVELQPQGAAPADCTYGERYEYQPFLLGLGIDGSLLDLAGVFSILVSLVVATLRSRLWPAAVRAARASATFALATERVTGVLTYFTSLLACFGFFDVPLFLCTTPRDESGFIL